MTGRCESATMAQALVRFLSQQRTARDGQEQALFAGVFGIFGHGNVAGIGEALLQASGDAAVLPAAERAGDGAHGRRVREDASNRLARRSRARPRSGPGATNMVTGAAGATINRVPVLLLPGDIFARRRPAPVLQQLESSQSQDVSVNDCFKPVSRYWDRINRPEQIVTGAARGDARADVPGRDRCGHARACRRTCRPRRTTTRPHSSSRASGRCRGHGPIATALQEAAA